MLQTVSGGMYCHFAAGEDVSPGMPRGGCDKAMGVAGAAAVGGGGEGGEEGEAGVFARLTDGKWYQGSWLVGCPQR
jgi:hypothetical protein